MSLFFKDCYIAALVLHFSDFSSISNILTLAAYLPYSQQKLCDVFSTVSLSYFMALSPSHCLCL